MPVAVSQVLEGMPEPRCLRRADDGSQVLIMVGCRVLFEYAASDTGMRNLVVVTLTGMGFPVGQVAAVMGLTPGYVSTLRGRARDHGSAGLVREMGRPNKLTSRQIAQARRWREENVSDVVIGQRLGVADTTIARTLKAHPGAGRVPGVAAAGGRQLELEPDTGDVATAADTRPAASSWPRYVTDTPCSCRHLAQASPLAS
jgi:transposase